MDIALIGRIVPVFVQAAWTTVELSLLSLAIGLTVAALIAMLRLSHVAALRFVGAAYVSVFRGTPALIQIFLLYFGGPQVGIQLEPFAAGAIALGLNIAAYMAESIRGGVLSVDRGQMEAARSLGFGEGQSMRWIVLPQAAKLMIRPLGVNAVALVKGTALVATISVVELTYTAQRFIGSTYKPFEIFAVTAVLYMIMVYGLTLVIDRLDRAYAGEA
ncbi:MULTISPECIES: amino acid ABC transporter permease [unclassified Shinella]|jgi:polar amino acid transport system permease protein|uniref:amino acid ABC transporter permease n=2 Tax=Shinella TaxID=323620 RepID=UPI0003C54DD6|nr:MULTISPECIES: amino acid ABC transporter permease [unclassified Shinella]MCA0339550.1 amino acid ABC transporter permease [Pseudomonadota bacterium]EYR77408.1 putative amino acid ABC transporter permease protein [Shinella sp. DD12]KNY15727.1 nickel transporter [Shinella sp. SUS2]KOC75881.1 nickel transporter [Shinella sp. GWS1]MCO5151110.1 amino acid ABC transporter permease [Shinella sp.]